MQELKKDYQSGNISDDKYEYLSKEYSDRLVNLDVTTRIRNMQGKNDEKSHSKSVQKSMMAASKKEDQELVNKYIMKPKEARTAKKCLNSLNSDKYAILAVVCLISTFLIGISFGLFNGHQITVPSTSVMINDTAFPEFLANITNVTIDSTSQSINNVGRTNSTSNNSKYSDDNDRINDSGTSNMNDGSSDSRGFASSGSSKNKNPSSSSRISSSFSNYIT